MFQLSHFSFLLRILIFFINFSPSSLNGSSSFSLSIFLFLRLSHYSYRNLDISSLFRVFRSRSKISPSRASAGCTIDWLSSWTVYVFGPLAGVAFAPMLSCFSARSNIYSPYDRDTVFDIWFYFFFLSNDLLSRTFAKLRRRIEMMDVISALFFHD